MAKYPLLEKFQKSIQNPPALSLGLSVFMVVLYCLSLFYPWIQADLRLQSTALTSFEREYESGALMDANDRICWSSFL